MLKEIKTETEHYFMDALDRYQGESKAWHDNGVLRIHRYWDNDNLHGEYKEWDKNGVLRDHGYYVDDKLHGESKTWDKNGVLRDHGYYVDGKLVHLFLLNPLTDIEKMLLVLKYGGLLLPRGDLC